MYIIQRLEILKELLIKIGIKSYYFCGIIYNVHFNDINQRPVDYVKKFLAVDVANENLYDASQHTAIIREDRFFVNQQIGIYRKYSNKNGSIPALFEIRGNNIESEGIAFSIDINNRYHYIQNGASEEMMALSDEILDIFKLMKEYLDKWGNKI
jgi:hypothetical protein